MLVSAQPQVTGSGFREWTAYSRVFFFFFNVYFVFPHGLINILVFNFFLISLFLLSSPPFMSLSLSLSQLFPPSLILHPSLPLSLSPHLPLASPSIPSCQCIQEYRLCFPGILLRLNSLPSNFQRFLFHFAWTSCAWSQWSGGVEVFLHPQYFMFWSPWYLASLLPSNQPLWICLVADPKLLPLLLPTSLGELWGNQGLQLLFFFSKRALSVSSVNYPSSLSEATFIFPLTFTSLCTGTMPYYFIYLNLWCNRPFILQLGCASVCLYTFSTSLCNLAESPHSVHAV